MKYILSILFLIAAQTITAQVQVVRDTILMGTRFQITLVDKDSATTQQKVDRVISEIVRIENLISEWIPTTQVSEINRQAGISPVKVDQELFDLTQRALYFSELSNGALDISFAAMDKIWKFEEGWMDEFPNQEIIDQAKSKINYQNIILDKKNPSIFLKEKGMKIGFGATGKGYAAEKAKQFAQQLGVKSGIINASGDLATWGNQVSGKPWKIGVNNPFQPKKPLMILEVRESAMTTSGSYEKYVMIDDVRHSHIIDPKTGIPVTGLTSVTVIGPNAEVANALSTSLMVLGKEKGLKWISQFPDYACLMLSDDGKIFKSKNFHQVKRKLK